MELGQHRPPAGPLIVCLLVHCCSGNIDSGKWSWPSEVRRAPSPVRVCFVCPRLLVDAQCQVEAFLSKRQDLLGRLSGVAAVCLRCPTEGHHWADRQGQVRVLGQDRGSGQNAWGYKRTCEGVGVW